MGRQSNLYNQNRHQYDFLNPDNKKNLALDPEKKQWVEAVETDYPFENKEDVKQMEADIKSMKSDLKEQVILLENRKFSLFTIFNRFAWFRNPIQDEEVPRCGTVHKSQRAWKQNCRLTPERGEKGYRKQIGSRPEVLHKKEHEDCDENQWLSAQVEGASKRDGADQKGKERSESGCPAKLPS